MDPVVRIQRAFRKWFYRNAVCCITLEKLKYPCFMYKSFGVNIFYDYLALNRYFKVSGKYTDPKTRKKYTNKDIERFYKESSLHFPNEKVEKVEKPNNNLKYNHPLREILNYLSRPEEYQPAGTVNFSTVNNFNFVTRDYEPSGTVNNFIEIRNEPDNQINIPLFDPTRTF